MKPSIKVKFPKPVPETLALHLPDRAESYVNHYHTILRLNKRYLALAN